MSPFADGWKVQGLQSCVISLRSGIWGLADLGTQRARVLSTLPIVPALKVDTCP